MSSTEGFGRVSTSLSPATTDTGIAVNGSKKRKVSDPTAPRSVPHRRKTACQSCRTRKVKCDNRRPCCAFCLSSGVECVYLDGGPKLPLDPATKLMVQRLDEILHGVEGLNTLLNHQSTVRTPTQVQRENSSMASHSHEEAVVIERSRDYLQIPACRTTADTVLTWPIWRDKYGADSLIGTVFHSTGSNRPEIQGDGGIQRSQSSDASNDIFVVNGGLTGLADERIPSLIDNFLQNVYTKNPVLDVEDLVRHGRKAAEHGLGWDGMSCLILIACALGCIARPFDECLLVRNQEMHSPGLSRAPSTNDGSSALLFAKDLQAGESCFVLACRRIGLLKTGTILGAQCHFYAGVYLMYTLRPLPSWNHFYQASISYQLYLKSLGGPISRDSTFPHLHHLGGSTRRQRRVEQSLYWSCFKSECEFRVELPLPQSEIANFEYPNMFPSPPSPASPLLTGAPDSITTPSSIHNFFDMQYGASVSMLSRVDTTSSITEEDLEIRKHSKRLCNEEESWYYYLTEVALRRIGNRIINTFFRQDYTSWANIKPLTSIALEFDAQVSSWSANLPDAMKQYETSSSIRAPKFDPLANDKYSSVSKELSWATDNRLLEMRSWLYQPFLYYAIHCGYPRDSATYPDIVAPGSRAAFPRNILNDPAPGFSPEDTKILQTMIALGIETNLKILEVRTLRHRHHGLWYDLRSIMTASLLLLALVRSGNGSLIPGGLEELVGHHPELLIPGAGGQMNGDGDMFEIGGKFKMVLRAFEFWADESPDLRRAARVLRELVRETVEMVTRQRS
jgi:hypothetical protein